MKSILLSIIIVALFPYIQSLAQGNFVPGSVFTADNDTIFGYINNGTPDKNAKYCFFKSDGSDNVVEYQPKDIKGYSLELGKLFISRIVTADLVDGNVFLEVLLEGIVNLYYLNNLGLDHYYLEKEGELYPLTNEKSIVEIENNNFEKESKSYVASLKYLMQDAFPLMDEIERTSFDHVSLINTTKQYHHLVCKDIECVVYYKEQKKINDYPWKITFGPTIGLTWSNLTMTSSLLLNRMVHPPGFDDPIPTYVVNDDNASFSTSKTAIIPGIFVNFSRGKRSSAQLELFYRSLNYSVLNIRSIGISTLYRYEFLRFSKLSPYVEIGVAMVWNSNVTPQGLYYDYDALDSYDNSGDPNYTNYVNGLMPYEGSKNWDLNPILGAGIRFSTSSGIILTLSYQREAQGKDYRFALVSEYEPYSYSSLYLGYNTLKLAIGF